MVNNLSFFEKDECNGYNLKKDVMRQKHKIIVEKYITNDDIESIIITGFECGGIDYWAGVNNENWYNEVPEDMAYSQYATEKILRGENVILFDVEDETVEWELTLEKILKGIQLNILERPFDCDIENGDSTTADCIIQFALFNEIVYG